ncbi:MAG: hypothetical protein NT145_01015, partial [Elusimicrobia bacterium]|nr:hypothetical protein [Elusimicrobiota bacterium]
MNKKIRLFIVAILMFFAGNIAYSQPSGAKKAFDGLDKVQKKASSSQKQPVKKMVKKEAKINDTAKAKGNPAAIQNNSVTAEQKRV